MQRREFFWGACGVLALPLAGCGGGQRGPAAASGPTVLGVARANGFGRFARAASQSDLGEILAGSGPFTLFAPTDAAFAASNAGRLDAERLRALLAYHVVPGQLIPTAIEIDSTGIPKLSKF